MVAKRTPGSGRPIRRSVVVGKPMWNVPDRGYVMPRLRDPAPVAAVEFTVDHLPGHQDYEDQGE